MAQIYIVCGQVWRRGRRVMAASGPPPLRNTDKLCISNSTAATLISSSFISSESYFEKLLETNFVAQTIYEFIDI